MLSKTIAILQLTRLNLPVGSLLLLWPTISALWIASEGIPAYDLLLIFVLGTVLMRSAGCVINDIADREFDKHVKRTFKRPLADGRLSVGTAWFIFLLLSILAVSLLWRLNQPTKILAVIGFLIAVVYPFVKRIFMLPQLVLGIAFSWGILMAYTAVLNELQIRMDMVVLFIGNFCWIVAYDTLYAMVDQDDDQLLELGSTALLLGSNTATFVCVLNATATFFWLLLGWYLSMSTGYYLAIAVIAGLFIFQAVQAFKPENRSGWFVSFKSNIWVGTALFIGVFVGLPDQLM